MHRILWAAATISLKVASILSLTATILLTPGYSHADILLSDNFDDNTLNSSLWSVDGTVVEANQRIEVNSWGLLVTQQHFKPGDYGMISISGTWWSPNDWNYAASDRLKISTRSDGIEDGRSHGQVLNGISFRTHWDYAVPRLTIVEIVNGVHTDLAEMPSNFGPGDVFDFLIEDDGYNLSFTITPHGKPSTTLRTTSPRIYIDNKVVFHTRENNNGLFTRSYFDDIQITGNQPPIADAGSNIVVECDGEFTPIQLDGSDSSDPDGDDLEFEWSIPAETGAVLDDAASPTPIGVFPVGPTLVTLTVTDGNGGMDVADVLVTVEDTTPPVMVCTTDKNLLWPPNHAMRDVWICVNVSDNCSNPQDMQIACTISSNEPDDANGDGSTTGDVDGLDGFSVPLMVQNLTYDEFNECFYGLVSLRAERNGANEGRVYSIVCDVVDAEGNEATASCVVIVPNNKRK